MVDELRQILFCHLGDTLNEALGANSNHDNYLLASRIYYYMLFGIAATYRSSAESLEELMGFLN